MDSSRHLAAILFTDIVGYTSMMQQNEMQAVAVIKHYNAVLEKVLVSHHGDLLNNYGDGTLCAFRSTAEAVSCAVELQQQLQDEPKVPLRIGLHVGEIFFEDGKVLGDGVNIASRIQSLGQANTILFSHEINDKIKNNPEFRSVSLGLFEFKNVTNPLEIFALTNEGLAVPKREQMAGKLKKDIATGNYKSRKWLLAALATILLVVVGFLFYKTYFDRPKFSGMEKSIAVVPFINISNDPQQDYFCDGMTDDIITQLSKIADLRVISHTTAMQYKGTRKSANEIGRELNVAAILEGRVQREGNNARINTTLIDVNTNLNIWANTYDRSMNEIFAIQSEVAQQIAFQLNALLTVDEKKRIEQKATNNIAAYEDYLKGRHGLYDVFSESRHEMRIRARKYFTDALVKDPNFALAWAGIARINYAASRAELSNRYNYLNIALADAIKGISYGPELSETHMVFGDIFKYVTLNPTLSLHSLQRAIDLNPNNAEAYSLLAYAQMEIGRFKEAELNLVTAKQLDRRSQLMQSAWYDYY